jgi:hypothetical protein
VIDRPRIIEPISEDLMFQVPLPVGQGNDEVCLSVKPISRITVQ